MILDILLAVSVIFKCRADYIHGRERWWRRSLSRIQLNFSLPPDNTRRRYQATEEASEHLRLQQLPGRDLIWLEVSRTGERLIVTCGGILSESVEIDDGKLIGLTSRNHSLTNSKLSSTRIADKPELHILKLLLRKLVELTTDFDSCVPDW